MKILKALLVFATIWMLSSGFFVTGAYAITSLTKSQVENVCGKDLQTANGHSGCTKKCANGTSTCIYDCSHKTGDCNGVAVGLTAGGGTEPTGPKFGAGAVPHSATVKADEPNKPRKPLGTAALHLQAATTAQVQ
jgi:hypothetical protein